MCGLCGVAGTITPDDIKVFKDLLKVSAIRGIDSTGIAVIPYDKSPFDPEIVKQVGNSFDLLDRKSTDRILSPDNVVFMGHTRWRTRGEVNKENAQPFDFPELIGTHNGTLDNSTKARLEGRLDNWGTDSAALYAYIAKNGLEAALAKMEKLDAAALVWWDKDTNKLNMYRNELRPLHFAFDQKHQTFYWASEAGMLHLVLNHNKIPFKKSYKLDANQLLTLDLPEKTGMILGKPHIKPIRVEPFKYPVIARKQGEVQETWGNWVKVGDVWKEVKGGSAEASARIFQTEGGQSDLPFNGGTTTSVTDLKPSGPIKDSTTGTVIVLKDVREGMRKYAPDTLQNRSVEAGGPFYKTARGQILDERAFDEKANEGCALNGEVPVFGEPVKFLRDDSFICASCLAEAKAGTLDALSAEAIESML